MIVQGHLEEYFRYIVEASFNGGIVLSIPGTLALIDTD